MHRFLPSPSASAVHFGFLTIHFYALSILIGIVVAISLGRHEYQRVGGDPEEISSLALWAIPSGIVGGRLYHLITSPDAYFGRNGRPLDAIKIWEGGLGIWGAISLGALVIYLRVRKNPSISFRKLADALAPGLFFAQAIGRWGNWFNIELFGKPTSAPWALSVPLSHRPIGYEEFATFHPTFLYESLWCAAGGVLLLVLSRRQTLVAGNIFLIYVATYCLGRFGIESLRIDSAHAIAGLRINEWVSAVGFCVATFYLRRTHKAGR